MTSMTKDVLQHLLDDNSDEEVADDTTLVFVTIIIIPITFFT